MLKHEGSDQDSILGVTIGEEPTMADLPVRYDYGAGICSSESTPDEELPVYANPAGRRASYELGHADSDPWGKRHLEALRGTLVDA